MNQLLRNTLYLLFLAAFVAPPSFAREIHIETLEWPPQIGSDLPEQGLNTALVRAAFEAAGHEVKIDFLPWSRALNDVLEGRADVVLGAYYNNQRAIDYIYSDLVYHVDVGLVTRPGLKLKSFKSLEELKPYRIGIVRGYANSEEFDAADYLNKQLTNNPSLNIRKLFRRRIDMTVMSFDAFRYNANTEGYCIDKVEFVQPPLQRHGLYIMASRAVPYGQEIIDDFNQGLKLIHSNGTYDEIVNRLR